MSALRVDISIGVGGFVSWHFISFSLLLLYNYIAIVVFLRIEACVYIKKQGMAWRFRCHCALYPLSTFLSLQSRTITSHRINIQSKTCKSTLLTTFTFQNTISPKTPPPLFCYYLFILQKTNRFSHRLKHPAPPPSPPTAPHSSPAPSSPLRLRSPFSPSYPPFSLPFPPSVAPLPAPRLQTFALQST